MESPKINSFIYRKKHKYGYQYFYVDLITEKQKELSSQVEGFIHADDEVTLTDIENLGDGKYKVLPVAVSNITFDGSPIPAASITVDSLIDIVLRAAALTLKRNKIGQDS